MYNLRPDFALAHVQKLYTDFLAAQQTGNQVYHHKTRVSETL